MDKHIVLNVPGEDICLRAVMETDCETLRQWKNANRFAFFSQDIISPAQQAQWFAGYRARPSDHLFMVIHDGRAIGCMGFRMIGSAADIYNVILGIPEAGGKGLMSKALCLMCSFVVARFTREIGLKVLRSNRAIEWYEKNGFRECATHETFIEMRLASFEPCEFVVVQ